MILTVDVGNSQITGGVFDNDNLVLQFRKTSRDGNSSDELGVFFRSVLRENGIDWTSISRIGCCSVVPSVNYSLGNCFKKYFGQDALFIQAGIKTGLKLKYSNPKEIGADRIAGAIGAVTLYPERDLIIIDMGSASTIDIVTKDKSYLGGAILPGLKMSMEALATKTAKLPAVELEKPEHVCGTNTVEAIQSGLFYGTLGGIKEICRHYKTKVLKNENALILGTGGYSKLFEDSFLFQELVPELVLLGVKKALEIN